jgi:hypothetical protein
MTTSVELRTTQTQDVSAVRAQVAAQVAKLRAAAQAVLLVGGTPDLVQQTVTAAMADTHLMPSSIQNRALIEGAP